MALLLLDAVWLLILGVCTLAVYREGKIAEGRSYLVSTRIAYGPDVGAPIPRSLAGSVPPAATLVFLSPSCPPCRDALDRIRPHLRRGNVSFVMRGPADDPLVIDMTSGIPSGVAIHAGQQGEQLRALLNVDVEPFVVQIADRLIVGKGLIRNANDFERFLPNGRRVGAVTNATASGGLRD